MGFLGNMCRELSGRGGVGIRIVVSTKLFEFNAMDEIMSRHSVGFPRVIHGPTAFLFLFERFLDFSRRMGRTAPHFLADK